METKINTLTDYDFSDKDLDCLTSYMRYKQLMSLIDNSALVKIINLKPLEIHENSIVTQGFTLDKQWKPCLIGFNTKKKRFAKVIDALITPEVAVFYTDKDTRNWPYTKKYKLYCNRIAFYTCEGLGVYWDTFPRIEESVYTSYTKVNPLLDNL